MLPPWVSEDSVESPLVECLEGPTGLTDVSCLLLASRSQLSRFRRLGRGVGGSAL